MPVRYMEFKGDQISEIVLGSAHFGNTYGIFPRSIVESSAEKILFACYENGINVIDTAYDYGNSQYVLGEVIKKNQWAAQFKIITKIGKSSIEQGEENICRTVLESLDVLGVSSIFGLLIHGYDSFKFWEKGLKSAIKILKDKGFIKYAGASLYYPAHALELIKTDHMDLFQIPSNPLDFRWFEQDVYEEFRKRKKLCFLRSLSLQGLLLAPDNIPHRLKIFKPVLKIWQDWCLQKNVTPLQGVLNYGHLLSVPLVLGMDEPFQVQKNLQELAKNYLSLEDFFQLKAMLPKKMDDQILLPTKWPKE